MSDFLADYNNSNSEPVKEIIEHSKSVTNNTKDINAPIPTVSMTPILPRDYVEARGEFNKNIQEAFRYANKYDAWNTPQVQEVFKNANKEMDIALQRYDGMNTNANVDRIISEAEELITEADKYENLIGSEIPFKNISRIGKKELLIAGGVLAVTGIYLVRRKRRKAKK